MNFTSIDTVEVSRWIGEGGMSGRWMGEDLCEMSPALGVLKLLGFCLDHRVSLKEIPESTEEIEII